MICSLLVHPTHVVFHTQNRYDGDAEIDLEGTTWGEVCRSCFVHSPKEWGRIFLLFSGILFSLYWFIFSLELLGTGAKVLTGCAAAGLFGNNTNPVASLVVGMLVTVLLQSSSTTTSIVSYLNISHVLTNLIWTVSCFVRLFYSIRRSYHLLVLDPFLSNLQFIW